MEPSSDLWKRLRRNGDSSLAAQLQALGAAYTSSSRFRIAMPRSAVDTKSSAHRARIYVQAHMRHRGWTVTQVTDGRVTYLEGTRGASSRIRVRVKARTKGTWQATVTSGRSTLRTPSIPTFWAFVDLSSSPFVVYVAPDLWVRRDIRRAHAEYLHRHGGHRARNDAPSHHAIATSRLEQWSDRWDQLASPSARRGV